LTVRQLNALEARQYAPALAQVLLDCVAGGASVSFLASLTEAEARSFFEHVAEGVERGDRILLAAFLDTQVVGTVQIVSASAPNQPHRADVAKLLVHRSARGLGIARSLMQHAEEASRLTGKTLLVLDTATGGAAEKLYDSMGWTRVGEIPNHALYPDGTAGGTTIFWKAV
jgi:ribosomal protein S18 acetylase RimI-like enzyme